MPTPEELARQNIDAQLNSCGWEVQKMVGTVEGNWWGAGRPRQAILRQAFEGRLG